MSAFLLYALVLGGGDIPFERDLRQASAKAQKRGIPVLLYFWSDWSSHCSKLDQGAFKNKEVVIAAKSFVPVIVNTDKDPHRLAAKYRIRYVPTLLFIDSKGKRLYLHKDSWKAERILRSFREVARRFAGKFWIDSLEKAMEMGKREHRLVIAYVPSKEKPKLDPETILRKTLGQRTWDFLYARVTPSDKALYMILDPLAKGGRPEELAIYAADIEPGKLRERILDLLSEWKKR